MAERDFLIEAFNDCVERLQAGESLEECLRRYPQHAAELRPILLGTEAVRRARPSIHEVEQARQSARFRFEATLRDDASQRRGIWPVLRYAAGAAAALILGVGVLTALAQSALPGDPLYGLKRAGEQALMALAGPADDGRLNDRRIAEIQALLAAGRAQTVAFEGEVGAQNGPDWQIGGLGVTVPVDAEGASGIRIGDRVRVNGHTTPEGALIAESLLLLERGLQPPTSTPGAPPSATVLPSATPTATPSATPTPTRTPTATLVPTATPLGSAPITGPTDEPVDDGADEPDDDADDDHSGSGESGHDDDGDDDPGG